MDDLENDLFGREFFQGLGEGFHGPLHVGLDDDFEFLDLAFLDLVEEVVQGDVLHGSHQAVVLKGLGAAAGDLAGHLGIFHAVKHVAGLGHVGKAQDFHGGGGPGRFHRLGQVVLERLHAAVGRPCDDVVTHLEGTLFHQEGGHRPAAFVEPGFQHHALGRAVRVGLEFQDFRLQEDHFQEFVQV